MGFKLVITNGDEAGREMAFDQPEVVFGRTAECDVIFNEKGVSRRHARILVEGSTVFIEDLGSSSGTQVNGTAIAAQEMRGGDTISLGSVCFSFKPDEPGPSSPTAQPSVRSAAERARLLRQGRLGKAKVWWLEASTRVKLLGAAGLLVLTLGPLGGVGYSVVPETEAKPVEPTALGSEPIPESFGLGPGVTFEHADEKTFDFQVSSAAAVGAVLHYQSKDIDSGDEVSITVNGTQIGWLTPDTRSSSALSYELMVPSVLIKANQLNLITFESVRNPGEANPWRIWNVWLEVALLPEKSVDWLIADAEEKFSQGLKKWDQRDIGAANRWDAYRYFRQAWLTVEALPSAKRRPIHLLARERMLQARTELDLKCRLLLVEAQSAYSRAELATAVAIFQQVKEYFPSRSHHCQARAEYDRQQLRL